VRPEVIDELLELARWAPNHHRTNPWRFRVLGPETTARLKEAAGPAEAPKLERAPTLVVASAVLIGDLEQDEEDVCATASAIYAVLLAAHARGLAGYWRRLEEGFVLKDMRTYARAPKFLERTGMYGAYGELAAGLFHDVFSLDGTPRKHLLAVARDALRKSPVSVRQLVSDGWAGVRAL